MIVRPTAHRTASGRRGLARTVVMALSSLVLVVALYVIYQRTSARDALVAPARTPDLSPPSGAQRENDQPLPLNLGADAPTLEGPEGVPGRGGSRGAVEYYDERGRKWLSVRFRTWRPVAGTTNEVEIDEPVIRFRTPRGQLVRAEAKHGHLSLRTLSSRTQEPQSGNLDGDVHITVDRLSDAQRQALPPDQRDQLDDERRVDINMQSVSFDMELSRLVSPGAFRIRSIETDIQGRGLSLRFNDLESRIENLVIDQGKSIELRGVGDQFAIDLEHDKTDPSAAAAPIAAGDGGGGGARTEPDTSPSRRTGTAITADTAITTDDADHADDAITADDRVTTGTTGTTPATPPPDASRDMDSDGVPILRPQEPARSHVRPTDTYTAVFDDDVRVTRYSREMVVGRLAADRLEILFDFGERQRDLARRNPHAARSTPSARDEKIPPADQDRVLLTWKGKLTVTSTRSTTPPQDTGATGASPSGDYKPQRLRVTAQGAPVELSDPTRRVTCTRLVYEDDSGQVTLSGDADHPAVVASDGVGRLTARRIDLDRSAGVASAAGPGRLETSATPSGRDLGKQTLEVEFGDRLDAVFRAVQMPQHDSATGQSQQTRRRTLQQTRFAGGVHMRHGDEKVDCDRITIDFALDANGDIYPTRADAKSNVTATSNRRFIHAARRMILDLVAIESARPPFDIDKARAEAVRRGKDPDTLDFDAIRKKYESKHDYRAGIKRLQAFDDVQVRDPDQAFEISASRLDCTFRDGRKIERGLVTPKPSGGAYVRFGDFSVATPNKIPFDVLKQQVDITGPGRMTFPTTQDLDGGKLDEPRVVRVSWTRSMRFSGDRNRAVFEGDVTSTTEGSDFRADKLRIDFRNVPRPVRSAPTAPNTTADWWLFQPLLHNQKRPEALPRIELASSGDRKQPTYIYATGSAKAVTRQFHPATQTLATRMLITGPTLAVDLQQEFLTVEGRGSLLIEDYKTPAPAGSPDTRQGMMTPFGKLLPNESSQTYVGWSDSMVYRYRTNKATFAGNVQVSHRTGSKMKLVAALQRDGAPPPPPGSGREASLRCNALEIRFLRDTAKATAGASRISGNEVDTFAARGDVMFEDSGISAIADAMTYHRADAVLQILGSDTRDAQLFDQRKRFAALRGPRFYWDRKTNQIKVHRSIAQIR